MNSRPLPYQGSALPLSYTGVVGAEDEVRTRDPQLGRLMLYRLSYFRFSKQKPDHQVYRAFSGRRWIRTTEGINQQIYSLPHLATLVFSQNSLRTFEPMEGIEPTTPRLQITCSGQLSYIGNIVLTRSGGLFPKGIAKVDIFFNSAKLFNLFFHFFAFPAELHQKCPLLSIHTPV